MSTARSPRPRNKGFVGFITDFRDLSSNIAKLAVALPLVDLVAQVGPPWPSQRVSDLLSSGFCILILMIAYAAGVKKEHKGRLFVSLCVSSIAFLFTFILYFYLLSNYVPKPAGFPRRVVVGRVLQVWVKDVQATDPSQYRSAESLLQSNEYDAKAIWEPRSVDNMRVLVLVVWIVLVIFYSSSLSCFVLWKRL